MSNANTATPSKAYDYGFALATNWQGAAPSSWRDYVLETFTLDTLAISIGCTPDDAFEHTDLFDTALTDLEAGAVGGMAKKLGLEAQIKTLSDLSDAAWEEAADTARTEATASKFVADWDACGERYIEARQAIARGSLEEARDVLKLAATLERRWGSDEHATKAIALLG